MHAAGEQPSMMKVKAAFNAHRKAELSYEVTKCASGQALIDLGVASQTSSVTARSRASSGIFMIRNSRKSL
jgi:hypothetical protein